MKTCSTLATLAAAGLAASAQADVRGVKMGPLWGSGPGLVAHGELYGNDGPVIYSQPSESPDGYFSDGVKGQFWSQRIADNFVLDHDYMVDGIKWWGSSENYTTPDLGNFKSFIVEFYNDGGGKPGSSLGSFEFNTGDVNATPTGFNNGLGGIEYAMSHSLSINLQGGVPYWVSIGTRNVNPGNDGFVWSTNFSKGDGNIAADFFDGGGYQSFFVGSDQAFELTGAVPAPGAGALLGLAGIAAARRRR